MKWITREHVKVDRVACPWLIKKFVDQNAEFVFVPPDKVMDEAKRLDAIPYDVKNVELGHHGKECSFEAILKKYQLTSNPALVLLGKIVNGADTDNTLYRQPEGPGLEAVAEGFRNLGYKDDHALNAAEWIVYDALYAYCQKMVRDGKPNGDFVWFAANQDGARLVGVVPERRPAGRRGRPLRCSSKDANRTPPECWSWAFPRPGTSEPSTGPMLDQPTRVRR